MDYYHIKVRELQEPTYVKVKDILPGKSGYNLYLHVVSKTILVNLTRFDGTRVVIADFVVGDETGVIKMRLRNDVYTDMIETGQTIIVRNCKIPVVNQHMRMQVDTFGKIEISKSVTVEKANTTNDVSSVVYDNFGKTNTKTDNHGKNKRENHDEVNFNDNANEDYGDYY